MKPSLTFGLTHVAIAVRDLQRTKAFYQRIFDMELMYDEATFIQLTTPGANDVIVFEQNESVNPNTGGIAHFGFRLRSPDSIGEIEIRIMEAGGTIIQSGEFVPGSPYVFFKDPDGYTVEVWYELPVG
ncbi:VOC family protein [Chryseolinea sp. T2]|uniref:VOC family protein n=1 Tax=Chryseolinea sp. T2 TaxID=3129255 RepID=UPI003078051F